MKKALESNDAKAIKRTLDALMQAQQKAGENLYKKRRRRAAGRQGRAGPAGGRPAAATGTHDDVIDAEVVEEKK